jgi:hypothetical protein
LRIIFSGQRLEFNDRSGADQIQDGSGAVQI